MRPESSRYEPFSLWIERSEHEVALVVVGELDLASANRLEQEVAQLRAAGATKIALDLRQVDFIDSTGLRVLISLRNDAKRSAHDLTLVAPPAAVRRIFEITGTRGLFDWRSDHTNRQSASAPPGGAVRQLPHSARPRTSVPKPD